ncbi:MAG: DUF3368 domain-containing protein [Pseudomonadota bacterium]
MREVISNTSPLQYLHQAEVLDLLPALFGRILVPEAVVAEIEEGHRRGVALPDLDGLPWLTVVAVKNRRLLPLITDLGPGEREVIALALESSDALAILDDALARRHAAHIGLSTIGTLAVLLKAKEKGLLPAVEPIIDRLETLRFRLAPDTRRAVLQLAGEKA